MWTDILIIALVIIGVLAITPIAVVAALAALAFIARHIHEALVLPTPEELAEIAGMPAPGHPEHVRPLPDPCEREIYDDIAEHLLNDGMSEVNDRWGWLR